MTEATTEDVRLIGDPSPEALDFLGRVRIEAQVTALRPDYRAFVLVAEGLRPGDPDEWSEALLSGAESAAAPPEHPHVLDWAEAFKAFGAKPQRTRPSVAALLRRVPELPRVDRLTDAYNAISVKHGIPLGGEDVDAYDGPLRLDRATGEESFDTTASGEPVLEHPEPGEVVWRDDTGVTCRRWNWRQCTRTRLTTSTTRAVFLFDALGSLSDAELAAAGEEFTAALVDGNPGVRIASRTVRA